MAAVLVDDTGAAALRRAVAELRADFDVPPNAVMSWKDHVKTHDRRRRAAEVLGGVENLHLLYVYAKKSALKRESYVAHPQRFYNYVAYKTYKGILWEARNWKGASARLWTRFGHVRHHDHNTTLEYVRREAAADLKLPHSLEQGLRWVSADQYLESQAADLFGGFLKSALWPEGRFGYTEPSYLLSVWPLLAHSNDCAIPLGIMSMPSNEHLLNEPWFPCQRCAAAERFTKNLQGPIH